MDRSKWARISETAVCGTGISGTGSRDKPSPYNGRRTSEDDHVNKCT